MAKELVEEFWIGDTFHQAWRLDDGTIEGTEMDRDEYNEIYGEEDPNDTGEYYTEWMPRYGGYQPDDND